MKKQIIVYSLIILAAVAATIFVFRHHKSSNSYSFYKPGFELHKPVETTFFFGGDIMLSRKVAAKMYAAKDFTLPFVKVKDKTSSADISFANLESPFSDKGNHSVDGSLTFNADPQAITGINMAGFDILSTANNHSLDQGQTGVDFTYNLLSQNNILPLGTGANCHAGQIITRNGQKFGFLGYTYTAYNSGGTDKPDHLVCDANDVKQVALDIQTMRPLVDYLVVSSHMGIEYERQPSDFQVKFSHAVIDAGADLMIGNHPHWIEPIENYKGKWIFYAMGNLVFDQMWSTETRQGLTATITFEDKSLKKIELQPVVIDNFCCPRWATADETKSILGKIGITNQILLENSQK